METKNRSSILLSIFKREGGEGILTKIINNENRSHYINQLSLLKRDENALLCFKQDELNWVLITNNRILEKKEGVELSIPFSELTEVSLAMQEELKDRIMDKRDFTRLALIDRGGRRDVVKFEKGEPFQGIYQMLFHIVSNRKSY